MRQTAPFQHRRRAILLGILAAALHASFAVPPGAAAQDRGRAAGAPADKAIAVVPRPPTMNELFERLRVAKDEAEAKGVAGVIERRWARSGSDTADLLMARAGEALEGGDQPLAVELLDRVVALQPTWAEAWFKRASVFYAMGDHIRAMSDLEETLAREPRHFGALVALGAILRGNGDDKRAYAALKRAVELYPLMPDVADVVKRLSPDFDGRDI